jgi:hypothetical protein
VKHTLSPVAEAAVVFLAVAYGLFAVWFASLRPFAVATLSPSGALREPIVLDVEAWTRHDAPGAAYAFAAPPDWIVDAMDPASVRLGRSAKELADAPAAGEGVLLETLPVPEGQDVATLAAREFSGRRPALYDVAVDGRPALFAVEFMRGRLVRQAVYVPGGETAPVVRSASMDPAAFSVLISTIKFYH